MNHGTAKTSLEKTLPKTSTRNQKEKTWKSNSWSETIPMNECWYQVGIKTLLKDQWRAKRISRSHFLLLFFFIKKKKTFPADTSLQIDFVPQNEVTSSIVANQEGNMTQNDSSANASKPPPPVNLLASIILNIPKKPRLLPQVGHNCWVVAPHHDDALENQHRKWRCTWTIHSRHPMHHRCTRHSSGCYKPPPGIPSRDTSPLSWWKIRIMIHTRCYLDFSLIQHVLTSVEETRIAEIFEEAWIYMCILYMHINICKQMYAVQMCVFMRNIQNLCFHLTFGSAKTLCDFSSARVLNSSVSCSKTPNRSPKCFYSSQRIILAIFVNLCAYNMYFLLLYVVT